MKIFWKVYFWIEIALSLFFFWLWLNQPVPLTLLIHRVRAWVMLTAIFGLAYQKRIGRPFFWRGVFFACLGLSVFSFIRSGGFTSWGNFSSVVIIFLGFEIIRYTGLALYAFRSESLWSRLRRSPS